MSLILIVDDNETILEYIRKILTPSGHTIISHSSSKGALKAFFAEEVDLVVCDMMMPEFDGFYLIKEMRSANPDVPIIMITGVGGVQDAVKAIQSGANDFIAKPFDAEEFLLKVEKNLEFYHMRREINYLRNNMGLLPEPDIVFGRSERARKLIVRIQKVAPTNASVLIRGESGTGKELTARYIHAMSPRRAAKFIAIDCSTLTETIIESELFGYVKGAFTGADRSRRGLLEEASGGTVFLDEIGNLTPSVQSKLLRFIQEREIKPVGSNQVLRVDVRIISATNADLKGSIADGDFRDDLYYRLAGIELTLPALRERAEDIPVLAEYFIRKYHTDTGRRVSGINPRAMTMLERAQWPGNIREMEHLIEYAMIIEPSASISPDTLRSLMPAESAARDAADDSFEPGLREAVADFEKKHILRVLAAAQGNRARAARMLGVSRSILYERLTRYGLE